MRGTTPARDPQELCVPAVAKFGPREVWNRFAQRPTHQKNGAITEETIARRKLSLPELAAKMDNVSKACPITGLLAPAGL